VQDDIFEDHDGVVDDQTDGGCEAAQSHQIETLIGHFKTMKVMSRVIGMTKPPPASPIAQEQHEE